MSKILSYIFFYLNCFSMILKYIKLYFVFILIYLSYNPTVLAIVFFFLVLFLYLKKKKYSFVFNINNKNINLIHKKLNFLSLYSLKTYNIGFYPAIKKINFFLLIFSLIILHMSKFYKNLKKKIKF